MTKLDDSFSPNVMKGILTIFKKIKIKINVMIDIWFTLNALQCG